MNDRDAAKIDAHCSGGARYTRGGGRSHLEPESTQSPAVKDDDDDDDDDEGEEDEEDKMDWNEMRGKMDWRENPADASSPSAEMDETDLWLKIAQED